MPRRTLPKVQVELEMENRLDIRQLNCWKAYINPKSPTYGNARQSALKAGYTLASAISITDCGWFKNKIRRMNLLSKAEYVLNKTLVMETTDEQGREKADLLRVQSDTAKFIAKTQGKDEGYSERSEITGKDGNPIIFMPAELMEKFNLDRADEQLLLN